MHPRLQGAYSTSAGKSACAREVCLCTSSYFPEHIETKQNGAETGLAGRCS